MRPKHKKTASAFVTQSLAEAITRAAHLRFQSQSEFIVSAITKEIALVEEPRVQELLAFHEAEIDSEREEALALGRSSRGRKPRVEEEEA